jgi:hypothetical protein
MPSPELIRKAQGLRCGRRGNFYGCQDRNRQDAIPYEYGVPIVFKASGLALAEHPDQGWIYLDADNRTVFEAEYFDNAPDEYREGLARIRAQDKVGFVDQEYRLVIPPQYDAAFGFDGGSARVCVGCHPRVWAKSAPERARRQKGREFRIDRSGKELRR